MGRGRSGVSNSMSVPYDQWGEDIFQPIYDDENRMIGYIEDSTLYEREERVVPITKKEILDDIKGSYTGDGQYGDEDTHISLMYANGDTVDFDTDAPAPNKIKTRGLIGAVISTGDYESVWGEEMLRGVRIPIRLFSEDGEGAANSTLQWDITGAYKVRQRVIGNKRETIRRSTVKKID